MSGPEDSRRRIFGAFWRKHAVAPQLTDADAEHAHGQAQDIDVREFTPPPEHQQLLSDYYTVIDNFPEGEIPGKDKLPPMPLPLRRLTSASQCGGMYPLLSPRPILRKPKYSVSPTTAGVAGSSSEPQGPLKRPVSCSAIQENELARQREEARALRRASTQVGATHVTRFDPRVVVTAFEDERDRQWYSGSELDGFKCETIELAYHCMLFNPHIAKVVSKAAVHPITGEKRKNKLYTLPVLNSLPTELDFHSHKERVDSVLKEAVKKILVVDPNKGVLKLFCRSLQKLFPHARVLGAQSGEEAFRLYMKESDRIDDSTRAFDIILVEQRLVSRREANRQREREAVECGPQSSSALASLRASEEVSEKPTSFSHLNILTTRNHSRTFAPPRILTGSKLLRLIKTHEDRIVAIGPPINEDDERLNAAAAERRALMIGISLDADRDRDTLVSNGADIIWGKPLPPMGLPLRNQLLSVLLRKRKDPALSMNIPEFAGDS